MDPIAHTLVGASLAETPLRRLTHLAGPTLILGANAPDIDAVTLFVGRSVSLGFRRGWTHGLLAMVVLPLLLAGLVLLVARVAGRRKTGSRAGPVVLLAYLGVLTHPVLDWLNTYGIRLLMPFDGTWFYGDTLFIVDPWLWLLTAASVVWARSSTAPARAAWILLGLALTALVVGFEEVPPAARLVWLGGVVAIAGVRVWGGARLDLPRIATGSLGCAALYIGLMGGGSRVAVSQVTAWLTARGDTPVEVMARPLPANPFGRGIVVVDDRHYHFLEVHWLRTPAIEIAGPAIERHSPDQAPIVAAAGRAAHVQGLMTWSRYPAYEVQPRPDGYRVIIRDVRSGPDARRGFANAVVDLDRDLQVTARDAAPLDP